MYLYTKYFSLPPFSSSSLYSLRFSSLELASQSYFETHALFRYRNSEFCAACKTEFQNTLEITRTTGIELRTVAKQLVTPIPTRNALNTKIQVLWAPKTRKPCCCHSLANLGIAALR